MTQRNNKTKNIIILTPVLGIIIFVALYILSAHLYPGGSQVDKNSIGFSWVNNYWCNLLNDVSINGKPNTAKPVAIFGMVILCLSLAFFWLLFPRLINLNKKLRLAIQVSGILAMIIAFLLFTNINHDLVINLSAIFGVVAAVGTFIGLCKIKWFGLFAFGLLNVILVGLNNYVYYTKGLIIYLPVIQKISFATFLIWICCIDVRLYQRERKKEINVK